MILQTTTLIPATLTDYLILIIVIIAMAVGSQLFNYKFGLTTQQQLQTQQRVRELQARMMAARDDPQELHRLQMESMNITRNMMKKTMIPSLVRCVAFLGVYWGLYYYFSNTQFFSSFIVVYFVLSLSISLIVMLIARLFRKKSPTYQQDRQFDHELDHKLSAPVRFSPGTFQFSPDMLEMKKNLEEKQKRGEIPSDINIDEEIHQTMLENMEEESKQKKNRDPFSENQNSQWSISHPQTGSKKSWKKRIFSDEDKNND